MTEEIKEVVEDTNPISTDVLDIEKLVKWTDEECDEFDKEHHVPVKEYRNLIIRIREIAQEANTLFIQYNQLRTLLANGDIVGYTVCCPNCKVSYNVKPDELNYNKEIQCQDCGAEYIQNKNIVGLVIREEAINEKNI